MSFDVAARRFAFTRKYAVRHVDPLRFDFLHAIAAHLEERVSLVVVGSGLKGVGPMVLEHNGAPMLGLLEGRTEGAGYLLVLHLAGFELRMPEAVTCPFHSQPSRPVTSSPTFPEGPKLVEGHPQPSEPEVGL